MIGGIVAIAYGIFVGIGGVLGYAQAKSKASLISGSICGVLLLIAGVMQLQDSEYRLTDRVSRDGTASRSCLRSASLKPVNLCRLVC